MGLKENNAQGHEKKSDSILEYPREILADIGRLELEITQGLRELEGLING